MQRMIYNFGGCTLDTQVYSVQRGGQSIRLRPKVFRMCLYLLEHRERVVSREELCAQLWPGRFVNQPPWKGSSARFGRRWATVLAHRELY